MALESRPAGRRKGFTHRPETLAGGVVEVVVEVLGPVAGRGQDDTPWAAAYFVAW